MRRILVPLLALLLCACSAPAPRETPGLFDKRLSFSILEDYDKDQALDQVEADFLLFRELGIDTWRGSFGWDDYEPEQGLYDFAWLHRFAELAQRHRLRLRPYVGYTPAWAAAPGGADGEVWNNPPADGIAWRRFVLQLATAMAEHPNVLSFEIYNEQNSPLWWEGDVPQYARVLRQGSDAVRAARGGDQVLPGGITYPDLEWVEALCVEQGEGAAFDLLPLHAYPETWPAEIALEDYLDQGRPGSFHREFLPTADAGCGRKPVWINEAGFATTPGRRSEREQANWWARAIATFAAAPRVEHIGIYEIKDHPRDAAVIGEPENYHLGLTSAAGSKKLAFHTVQRLVALLGSGTLTVADAALTVRVTGGKAERLFHHLFIRPDGRQVLVVWDKAGAPTLQVELPRAGGSATEYGLDGAPRPHAAFDGRRLAEIRLTPGEVRIFAIGP